MRLLIFLLALYVAATLSALAGDLPEQLTFGYEYEGEIDVSPAACEATVREVVEWSEDDVKRAVKEVCAARQAHVDAYAALQQSYKNFSKAFGEDTRLDTAAAVDHFQRMIKACIDHKTGITTGGHNITIDIIPNQIAARCLAMGKGVLDDEIAWVTGGAGLGARSSP